VSLSTAFAATALAALAATLASPGCMGTCNSAYDCPVDEHCEIGQGICISYCNTNEDCLRPPECIDEDPQNCAPRGSLCKDGGRCEGRALVAPRGGTPFPNRPPVPEVVPGMDLPPADGLAFIMNRFGINETVTGFNVDGTCNGAVCEDNSVAPLGRLGNSDLERAVNDGESLLLVQLSGLDSNIVSEGDYFTIRLYAAIDENLTAADNFERPPGSPDCCEFKISSESLTGGRPDAAYPAVVGEAGHIESLVPVDVALTMPLGTGRPYPRLTIAESMLRARIGNLDALSDGVIGGAVTVNSLAAAPNPYCKNSADPRCPRQFATSSLLDLLVLMVQPYPDIDLDVPPDGLETFETDSRSGRIAGCRDGCVGCVGPVVPAPAGSEAWTCARDQRMADGFSIGLFFEAVPATITGIGR